MQLNPYLYFDGRCEEAFKFYEKVLGATIEAMMTYEGSPAAEHVPAEWRKKIMHATLLIEGEPLMGSDPQPQYYSKPEGFSVSLSLGGAPDAERVFKALAENGEVIMPLEPTFWAVRFGMVRDRFGIPWMINCDQES